MSGPRTARELASEWRAKAGQLRGQCEQSRAQRANLVRMARADELDLCAKQLMTELHIPIPAPERLPGVTDGRRT